MESKIPKFKKDSKMSSYEIIFDEDKKQMRAGFFDDKFSNIEYSKNFNDIYYTIEPGFEYRSDLISHKHYGTAKYDWFIEQINNIKDPIKDLTVGRKLLIISYQRLISYI